MIRFWLWLVTRKPLRPSMRETLLRQFFSPDAIFAADAVALMQVPGIREQEVLALLDHSMEAADRILEDCQMRDVQILTRQDAQYPQLLNHIPSAPMVLYYRGRLPQFALRPGIALVGSRQATPYGILMARQLGYQLGRDGAIVVSGAALGVDRAAMEGAMSAEAPVVGVLGCGVDLVYPKKNEALFQQTLSRGCLISEYPPGTLPLPRHFPVRNRIIAGLSLGVVVVEAAEKSGALITADLALQQGRDVFAVPGNVGSEMSRGCNKLLQQGAGLVRCGWDVLQEYEARYPSTVWQHSGAMHPHPPMPAISTVPEMDPIEALDEKEPPQNTEKAENEKLSVDKQNNGAYIDLQELEATRPAEQVAIIRLLQAGPMHADDIVEQTELSAGCISAALLLLEVAGLVVRLPGRRYCLAANGSANG